jgi:hypothetical protein
MRQFNVKLWGCIGLLAGLSIILGCGSGTDLLDQTGYRYQISLAVPEDRNVSTSDIDVYQSCNDVYSDGDEDEDSITKAQVEVTFQSQSDTPDIWVYRVQIEYTLLEAFGTPDNTPVIPTNISNVDIFIPGDGGTSTASIDLLTITDKEIYTALIGNNDNGIAVEAVFQVRLTAYLTYSPSSPNSDSAIEVTKDFTINVGNYYTDSCNSAGA